MTDRLLPADYVLPNSNPPTVRVTASAASAQAPPTATKSSEDYDRIHLWHLALCGRECAPVTEFGQPLYDKIQRLYNSLGRYGGVGIAAPQVGIFEQIAIVHHPELQVILINPKVVVAEGETLDWEACLSLPGVTSRRRSVNNKAKVKRARSIQVNYQDDDGKARAVIAYGYPARVCLHEVDHLKGRFFIDHVGPAARRIVLRRLREFMKCLEDER